MIDALCSECDEHFAAVKDYLAIAGTEYRINNRMVRGLDYYTRTTFEVVTSLLGSQSAVAAGGRYDGLVSDLGGPAIPGIGFAMGVERVALLLDSAEFKTAPELFIVALGEAAQKKAFSLAAELQRAGISVELDYEGKSMKSQMRRADKLASTYTLIIGDTELSSGKAPLKEMSSGLQQETTLDSESIVTLVKRR
jgi:histidyl-tRNA synthetase